MEPRHVNGTVQSLDTLFVEGTACGMSVASLESPSPEPEVGWNFWTFGAVRRLDRSRGDIVAHARAVERASGGAG